MPDFLIVNFDRTYGWKGRTLIEPFGRPKRIYDDQGQAEQELIRLGTQNKGEEFTLFQSIATVEYRDGQVFMKEIEEFY